MGGEVRKGSSLLDGEITAEESSHLYPNEGVVATAALTLTPPTHQPCSTVQSHPAAYGTREPPPNQWR